MDELVTWLRAQLDDDERVARAATWGPWEVGPTFGGRDNRVYVKPPGPGIDTIGTCVIAGQVANMPEFRANAEHIARWDPARVLAEVEAKRRILDLHKPMDDAGDDPFVGCDVCSWRDDWERLHVEFPCDTIRLLAQPYAGRDGWRAEWQMDG